MGKNVRISVSSSKIKGTGQKILKNWSKLPQDKVIQITKEGRKDGRNEIRRQGN
jgi:hypothetical protein